VSTRRVLIGKDLAGVFGLKVSLPGFDVLTDDENDANKFSFNSKWTDLVKVHLVGTINAPVNNFSNPPVTQVPYSVLPYRPFVEIRPIRDGLIRDDWTYMRRTDGTGTTSNLQTVGVPFSTYSNVLNIELSDSNTKLIYVILKAGV